MADAGYSRTFLSRNGSPIITHETYCSLGIGSNWLFHGAWKSPQTSPLSWRRVVRWICFNTYLTVLLHHNEIIPKKRIPALMNTLWCNYQLRTVESIMLIKLVQSRIKK